MVKTKIILQPKKHFLDRYFHTDTKDYIFGHSQLYSSEIFALGAIAETFRPHTIVKIPEVHYPWKMKTPDFLVDGIKYEVKAPLVFRSIRFLTQKAETQLKTPDGFLVMELMNIQNVPLCTSLQYAYNYFIKRKLKNFIIMNRGDILYSTR